MIESIAGAGLGHQPGPGRQKKALPKRPENQPPGSADRVTLRFSGSRDIFQVLLEVSAQRVREDLSAKAPAPEAWPKVKSAQSAASSIVKMASDALSSSGQHRSLKELNGKVAKLKSSIDEAFTQSLQLISAMGPAPGDLHVSVAEAYRLVMEGIRSFYWEEAQGLGERVSGL